MKQQLLRQNLLQMPNIDKKRILTQLKYRVHVQICQIWSNLFQLLLNLSNMNG